MRYLLDVNALIALAQTGHVFHAKAGNWFRAVTSTARGFHTCSITEIGFVRVSVVTGLQPDIATARQALASSKIRFELIPDDLGVAQLPAFVKRTPAITDGHLFELARKNSMQLVTFDQGIPNALCIG
jgi:predicted nucleic acid-binding protein